MSSHNLDSWTGVPIALHKLLVLAFQFCVSATISTCRIDNTFSDSSSTVCNADLAEKLLLIATWVFLAMFVFVVSEKEKHLLVCSFYNCHQKYDSLLTKCCTHFCKKIRCYFVILALEYIFADAFDIPFTLVVVVGLLIDMKMLYVLLRHHTKNASLAAKLQCPFTKELVSYAVVMHMFILAKISWENYYICSLSVASSCPCTMWVTFRIELSFCQCNTWQFFAFWSQLFAVEPISMQLWWLAWKLSWVMEVYHNQTCFSLVFTFKKCFFTFFFRLKV